MYYHTQSIRETMPECTDASGLECSYVKVKTDDGNVTLFTWWITLAHDPNNDPVVLAQFTILLVVTVIAVLANIIILAVITSNKKLCKIPTHQYTAAQNVNYLWFISVSPMILVARRTYTWKFTTSLCKAILYTFSVTTFIAIWLFVFISMDRHIHVVQSLRKSRLSKIYPRYPVMAILILVIFSVLFYIPLILYFDVMPVLEDNCTTATKCFSGDINQTIYVCTSLWRSEAGALAWNIIMLCISYIIPTIIISYNYWEIFRNVRKVRKRIQKKRRGNRVSKREMEIHVTMMCGMLVTLFIIMWTPVFIVLFLVQFARVQEHENQQISADLFYWIFSLTLANAMVNPLVYAFMNKKFMKAWEDYRFPCIDKLSCWQKIVQKGKASKVVQSTSENSHSNGQKNVGIKMMESQRHYAIRRKNSSETQKEGISFITTPPTNKNQQSQP